MFEIFPIKSVAIILDFDVKTAADGRTQLDVVRESIIQNVMKIETDDRLYLYSPEGALEMFDTIGQMVAAVKEAPHVRIDVPVALKESVFLVGQYDHAHRAVFLLTNRYRGGHEDFLVEQAIAYDTQKGYDTKFYFYAFGFACDRRALRAVAQRHSNVVFRHYPEASGAGRDFENDFSDLIVVR